MIVGVDGQDGQLLSKHLKTSGHTVIGIGRRPAESDVARNWLDSYHHVDVGTHMAEYGTMLDAIQPSAIFYAAAVHGPSGTELEGKWQKLQETTIIGLHQTLEFARSNKKTRVINFSSSRVFGDSMCGELNENTLRKPSDIYGVVKNSADDLVQFYHAYHAIQATSLIFFNHESNLRNRAYFSSKLVQSLRAIQLNKKSAANFVTLDFWTDWGLADEYMKITATVFEQFRRPHYVFATGKTCHAHNLIVELCHELSIDERLIVGPHFARSDKPAMTLSPPWTAQPEALLADTHSAPCVTGKDVFLALLAQAI